MAINRPLSLADQRHQPVNILLVLIPITLLLVTVGILVFNWAVKSGQYDDLEGPAHRILYDDDQDMIPDDAKQPENRPDTPDHDAVQSGGDADPSGRRS